MKTCTSCDARKPYSEFGPSKRAVDGLKSHCRTCEAAATRRWRAANPELARDLNRRNAAERRADPEKGAVIRARQRAAYAAGGKERQRENLRRRRTKDFFRYRATRSSVWLSAAELECLWTEQGGRCALTGRPLDKADAQLDHKVPKSRGGPDTYENAQWLCRAANLAKRDLLDEEFVELCREVLENKFGEQFVAHLKQGRAAA